MKQEVERREQQHSRRFCKIHAVCLAPSVWICAPDAVLIVTRGAESRGWGGVLGAGDVGVG